MSNVYAQPGDDKIMRLRSEGRSYRDIAIEMGMPFGTICSRMTRLRMAALNGGVKAKSQTFGEALRQQRLNAEIRRVKRMMLGLEEED